MISLSILFLLKTSEKMKKLKLKKLKLKKFGTSWNEEDIIPLEKEL